MQSCFLHYLRRIWFRLEHLLHYLKNCHGGIELTIFVLFIKEHLAMTLNSVGL
jgi:hypothetical protein